MVVPCGAPDIYAGFADFETHFEHSPWILGDPQSGFPYSCAE